MEFMKVFHIDNGRKYFSLNELKEIADILAKSGYNFIELAVGNGGMRFLLDDMRIELSDTKFSGEAVSEAITYGNKQYCDCGANELTEAEMLTFIDYCNRLGIGIIPLINTPGHMDAIVSAMEALSILNVRYRGSATTIDLENIEALSFTKQFITKYIDWFAARGIKYFNMGCDEYANDVLTSGFESLCSGDGSGYCRFTDYVNSVADIILKRNMTPIMFNDGMYYNQVVPAAGLNPEIICSYWSSGWEGYRLSPAALIESMGHKILNTSNIWYYVLGRRNGCNNSFTDEDSLRGISSVSKDEVIGGISGSPIGAMFCLWCDEPSAEYNNAEKRILKNLLSAF